MPHGKKSKFATHVIEVIKRAGLYKRGVILRVLVGKKRSKQFKFTAIWCSRMFKAM